jgi:hypothetical protein
MAERLGVPTGPRVRLYLADEQERFMDLQPSQPPEWADGTAWPHRGLVFLRAPRARAGTATDLEIVLDHELVHVLLGRAFGDRAVPRWLQEGMARFLAGEYGPETTDELARGILGKGLIALDELASGFPRDPIRAQLAYAQSADLVAWIHGEFGPQVLPEIVQRMASGTPFGAAMYGATGRTVTELDRAWRSRLQSSPLWLRPLTSEGTWWALGGIILTVGWWSVQRRNRRKLARWRRDEELRDKLFEQLWQSRFVPPEPLGVPSVGRPGGDDTEVAR